MSASSLRAPLRRAALARLRARGLALGLAALLLPAPGCGGCAEDAAEPTDVLVARSRAAAWFAEDEFGRALEALLPFAERDDASLELLVDAGNTAFEASLKGTADALPVAKRMAERARAIQEDHARVQWLLYQIAYAENRFEDALAHVRRAAELAPESAATRLAYGAQLATLRRDDEAAEQFRWIVERGEEHTLPWYPCAVFRLSQHFVQTDRPELADRLFAEYQDLQARGVECPSSLLQRGELGVVDFPARGDLPDAAERRPAAEVAPRRGAELALAGFPHATPILPSLPERSEEAKLGIGSLGYAYAVPAPQPALLVWGPAGLGVAVREGAWEVRTVLAEPVAQALGVDFTRGEIVRDEETGAESARFEDETDLDLVAALGGELVLLLADGRGGFERVETPLAELPDAPRDLEAVDFDHDGDLDLLAVGAFGARLLRNDGVGLPGGALVDVTDEAGLPRAPLAWAAFEDLDGDDDVDLLMGGEDGAYLASSLRGGRFADESARLPRELAGAPEPVVADLDDDGRPDLATLGERALLFSSSEGEEPRFERAADVPGPGRPLGAEDAALADLVLVADNAVFWADPEASAPLGPGPFARAAPAPGASAARALALDADRDLAPDLLAGAGDALAEALLPRGERTALGLVLAGEQDSSRGVGAVVEVRAGPHYRRIYWRGAPEVVGLAGRPRADVVRVTWPNGVVQYVVDLAAGRTYLLAQRSGLAGSCPFLYAWNGTTYELVSDVLGITPLGLPMAPGALVPPDHDEYVLVRGDQLVPREGWYEIQLTEELREVTYLDRVRLDVVDHPAGTEVFPNERFCFPPFPEPRTWITRAPLAPARAVDGAGRDWTRELAAEDRELAVGFEPYAGPGAGRFQGLAPAHVLELAFDPARVPAEGELALFLTGWFLWTNASVNVAAARTPGVEFVPPILQVPDGAGGWVDAGPPIGFPAGKLKTMVVDVTDVLRRDDPRLRLRTTLRIYWDAIRLGVAGADEPVVTTPIEPAAARLWQRGFSRAVPLLGAHALEWFEWDAVEEHPRWDQHPGRYTRLGEVLPLVTAIDDRFVILGAGDALTVRFPADAAPPLPAGWTRDYLVFLDGWAKDRDPNTLEALRVEPLPFHGMSGYPYGPDERYPDDAEHRAYRAEWNTRPATRWIEPLAAAAAPAPDR